MIKQNPVKGKRSTGDWEFCNSHKELGKKLKLLCGRLSESIILPAALRRPAKYDRSKSIRWRYCTAALITNQRLERDFLWMMDDTQYWIRISVIQEIGIEVNTILFFIPVNFSDHHYPWQMKSALAVFSLLLAMVGVSTGDDAQGRQQQFQYQQFGQTSPSSSMDPNMMLMMVSQRNTE